MSAINTCLRRIGSSVWFPHVRQYEIVPRGGSCLSATKQHNSRTFSSTSIVSNGSTLTQIYNRLVHDEKLLFDPEQERVTKRFTRLQMTIDEYDHKLLIQQLKDLEEFEEAAQVKSETKEESADQISGKPAPPSITVKVPRGIYIYGDVGTGKSLLMDMFYASSPVDKRRLHFHSLLQEIHSRIFELNKQILAKHGRSFHVDTSKKRNSIIQIAQQFSSELTLLCIDEFQVTDVADAMILSQLFGELWRRGVVVVATSNRPPQDLYEDGLNRSYFLPFIDLVEKYCSVVKLGTHHNVDEAKKVTDYRRIKSGIYDAKEKKYGEYYFLTSGKNDPTATLDRLFDSLQTDSCTNGSQTEDSLQVHTSSTKSTENLSLPVKFQRNITISRSHSNIIARFTFEELCTTELGSSDYQAIAKCFQVIMIENIPQLTLKYPDRARRFITLIDELYESGCCLTCSAEEVPDNLFVGKVDSETNRIIDTTHENKGTKDMMAIDVAQSQGMAVSELASVKELSFAFRRAASRLLEMCSSAWWSEKGFFYTYNVNK